MQKQNFTAIWTYIANYGRIDRPAKSAEDMADMVFAGFSDDFRLRGKVYVMPSNLVKTYKMSADGENLCEIIN